MKLSTRGRYGLRAMLELADNYGEKPMLLRNIAKNQDISERYLENIMTVMVAGGLVKSMRGKNGGFNLVQSPESIKASRIIQLLEGSLAPVACVDDSGSCTKVTSCVTRDIWEMVKDAILGVLEGITLKDMQKMARKKKAALSKENGMYYI